MQAKLSEAYALPCTVICNISVHGKRIQFPITIALFCNSSLNFICCTPTRLWQYYDVKSSEQLQFNHSFPVISQKCRICIIRHCLVRKFAQFVTFLSVLAESLFCVYFCLPNSPSSNSSICLIRHFFVSFRSILFG